MMVITVLKRYLWLFLISGPLFMSCQKLTDTPGDDNGPSTQLNISYGSDPLQKMDIYLPGGRNTTTTKVMVLIHGGGWTEGDKADFTSYVSTIQTLLPGYAIFNINYRLAANNSNLFPTQENDVKAAIDLIYSKRNDYKISGKFVLLGASAGGHLALLQGYKYTTPVKVKAVVSFFGPTDLNALFNSNIIAAAIMAGVVGGTPTTHASMYQQSSPATFVNASTPPTILLQGGIDPLVPPAQAEVLKTALGNAGVINQYVFYPNEGHGWIGANLTDSFTKIAAFLNANVN